MHDQHAKFPYLAMIAMIPHLHDCRPEISRQVTGVTKRWFHIVTSSPSSHLHRPCVREAGAGHLRALI
jgi:hypothetical protein